MSAFLLNISTLCFMLQQKSLIQQQPRRKLILCSEAHFYQIGIWNTNEPAVSHEDPPLLITSANKMAMAEMLILRYQSRTWETSGWRHSSYFHLFVTVYVFLKFLRINILKFSKIWKWCKWLMWLWLSCVIITTYQTCRQLNFVFFPIQMHNPSYSSCHRINLV